jgi:hypothetical protein
MLSIQPPLGSQMPDRAFLTVLTEASADDVEFINLEMVSLR